MSTFVETLARSHVLLAEGSMYDRLKRIAGQYFDPDLDHLGLIYSEEGRAALELVYGQYIDAATSAGTAAVVFTPTWRGNTERISRSRYNKRNVNSDGARFLLELRNRLARPNVFIGGLMGCKNDCYDAAAALDAQSAAEFHRPQISELALSGIDFLFASTLPSTEEAIGIAAAMAGTGLPYALSFVVDGEGRVLDGTPFPEAIDRVDRGVGRPPLGYCVNCVHPQVLLDGLRKLRPAEASWKERFIGFQGNTSRSDPRGFDSLAALETEPADRYAAACISLQQEYGLKILGGCCGTGPEHIRALAEQF